MPQRSPRNNLSSDPASIARWKRAVIHLEVAEDSLSIRNRLDSLRALLDVDPQDRDEMERLSLLGNRDARWHGAALFVSRNERRYLLTARHVVYAELGAQRALEEKLQWIESGGAATPPEWKEKLRKEAREERRDEICSMIFRAPSLEELLSGWDPNRAEFLMSLGAGTSGTVPFTFSDPELDLAVISLDARDARFADQLIAAGYVPISYDEIEDAPSAEGAEVFVVGYPAPSFVHTLDLSAGQSVWSSKHVSLPTFAFGRIAMLSEHLPYFWADINVTPGNSGGPVVEEDRLVGIVSGQARTYENTFEDDTGVPTGKAEVGIPYGRIIKASYAKHLFDLQERKDRGGGWNDLHRPVK